MATLLVAALVKGTAWQMALLTFAAGLIDQKLFGPGDQTTYGAKLGEQKVQISTYGSRIPTLYGKNRVAGNVIWATKYVEHRHEESQGGKGGPKYTTVNFTYTCSFAIGLADCELFSIERIWADGNLITPAYTFYPGSETQMPDATIEGYEGVGNAPAYRGLAYVVFEDFDLTNYGNRIPVLTFECVRVMNKLCNIVRDIVTASGIDDSELSFTTFSDFDAVVSGYVISSMGTHRSALEPLQAAYFFDMAETRGLLRCIRRGAGETVTVDAADLAAHEGENVPDSLKSSRKQEMELPQRLIVTYLNKLNDYQTATVEAKRIVTSSSNAVNVSIPIVLTTAEAMELAEKLLYETWMGRLSRDVVLPTKYAYVAPGNVLNVTTGGKVISGLVQKSSYGKPGLAKLTVVDNGAVLYLPVVRTADPDIQQTPRKLPSDITMEVFETNLLLDGSVPYRPYVAVYANVFYGVNVLSSADGGATYQLMQQIFSAAREGYFWDAYTPDGNDGPLAPGPADYIDRCNTIEVEIVNGTLESVSELALLNGANVCLLGDEILQFQTAVLTEYDSYILSNLLRGRRGTEWAMATHTYDDRFVLLSPGTIEQLQVSQASMMTSVQLRYGPTTMEVTDASYKSVTIRNTGMGYMPYAVVHEAGMRDDSGNLTISWIRRTRIGGAWNDYSDVPLSEDSERYEVDVMDGDTVKRTIASVTQEVVYTAAEQTEDFGSPQAEVAVRIYQLSAIRGRGHRKEAIV